MSTCDPMAAAIDWLDAYRAAKISIVDLYGHNASLRCGCNGETTVVGRCALTKYWRQRFMQKPAGSLECLQADGDCVVVSYRIPDGIVRANLRFNDEGEIIQSYCGPVIG